MKGELAVNLQEAACSHSGALDKPAPFLPGLALSTAPPQCSAPMCAHRVVLQRPHPCGPRKSPSWACPKQRSLLSGQLSGFLAALAVSKHPHVP